MICYTSPLFYINVQIYIYCSGPLRSLIACYFGLLLKFISCVRGHQCYGMFYSMSSFIKTEVAFFVMLDMLHENVLQINCTNIVISALNIFGGNFNHLPCINITINKNE